MAELRTPAELEQALLEERAIYTKFVRVRDEHNEDHGVKYHQFLADRVNETSRRIRLLEWVLGLSDDQGRLDYDLVGADVPPVAQEAP